MTVTPISIPEEALDRWRRYYTAQQADQSWTRTWEARKDHRRVVRAQLLEFLRGFLDGTIPLPEFQTTFDRKTRRDWDGFGLKGLNGAMFLNMMVKYVPASDPLDARLRPALTVPDDLDRGLRQLQAFLDYLNGIIRAGRATRRQVQPARAPFLLSSWWHQQDPERWPVSYPSARRVLERDGLFRPNQVDLVGDYRSYLTTFTSLQHALGLETWDFEGLCYWLNERPQPVAPVVPSPQPPAPTPALPVPPPITVAPAPNPDPSPTPENASPHAQAQWHLAAIGRQLNCRIWIPPNDRNRSWNGQRLGELSIGELPPLGIGDGAQKIVRWIDLLWLRGQNQVVAAFEVEHSTSIHSGLLRMSDLTTLAPNLSFPLYIVAPEQRLGEVRRELSRPTFQTLDLHQRCGFFSIEVLAASAEHMMRFANDPSVIDVLAERVGDVSEEDTMP